MNKSSHFFLFTALLVTGLFFSINAQDITTNPNPPSVPFGQIQYEAIDAVTITHSVDPVTVTALMSVACTSGGITSDNQYFRAFVLADFGITDDYDVTMVEVGIETAVAGSGGEQPMTVNLYTIDAVFPTGTLTPIGTATVMVPDQDLTLFQIPITGTAPAGSELVVEISIDDATTGANHTFFLGANNLGQTADSWLSSAGCGITTPVTTQSIGFPDAMWVMSVTGDVGGGPTLITIAEAREDLNMDFIPDRLGDTVTVAGTVSSPNYNTGNFNYVVHDGTAGITSILFGYVGPEYNMGDVLQITGEISQYNGLTQIEPLGDGSSSVILQGTGGTLPDYMVLTINDFLADAEMYEGDLLAFVSLSSSGPWNIWPTTGNDENFWLQNTSSDTMMMRIDKETDLDENPEPSWPKDVIGFGSQYTSSSGVYDDGYQILARMYSEFLPPGTVPVELTSFIASVNENNVTLNWTTATETNNLGFEIQRNSGNDFQTIGFVNGNGTTTETQEYSFTDVVTPGSYSYRLKQVDYNGIFSYSETIQVEIVIPDVFALEQNYPNPFNPSTRINFSLAVDSKVSLKVFDVLGQEVTSLINSNLVAGSHNVDFNASGFNSGVYFYRIDATGINGTNFTSVKKMILTK